MLHIGLGLRLTDQQGASAAQLAFTGSLTIEHGSSGPQFDLIVQNNPATNPYDGFAEVSDPDNVSTLSTDAVTISGALGAHSVTYKATSSGGRPDLMIALTVTIVDTTSAALSNPTDTQTGQTTATLTVDTDTGEGTLYAVATTSSTAPTAAQVMAGQDHTGAAASYAGSVSVSSTGTKSFSATGLVASTAYTGFFVQKDASNNVSAVSAAAGFTTASASNGNDANTVLLLHMDGTNGSTTFTDSAIGGGAPHTVTANSTAQIDTSIVKLGTGAGKFDGGGYLSAASTADLAFGTGDFTIDFWVQRTNNNGSDFALVDLRSGAGTQPMVYYKDGNGISYFENGAFQIDSGVQLTVGSWYHVALVRSGGTSKLYMNGTQSGSSYVDSVNIGSSPAVIGGGTNLFGNIDELRISNVARWTSNFTPPSVAYS